MLDVVDGRCTIFGGGPVAAERARTLKEHGARVTVVSPEVSAPMAEMLAAGDLSEHHARRFAPQDIDGCHLVVAATDDAAVNAEIAREANARSVLCNVAGSGARGDVTLPAVIRHDPLAISVSTTGASPRFTRILRDRLGGIIDSSWGELAAMVGGMRREIEALPSDRRDAVIERMMDGPARAMIAGGVPRRRVHEALRRELSR